MTALYSPNTILAGKTTNLFSKSHLIKPVNLSEENDLVVLKSYKF